MHRLYTVTVLIVSSMLIAQGANARPHIKGYSNAGTAAEDGAAPEKSTPKLLQPAIKGKSLATAETRARRLRTARNLRVQWQPGLVSSRNVKILRMPLRGSQQSGEKGGTEDINIGVGELQECTISKSMDSASPFLARMAKSRRRLPRIVLTGTDGRGRPVKLELKNAQIKSYQLGSAGGPETAVITYTGLE